MRNTWAITLLVCATACGSEALDSVTIDAGGLGGAAGGGATPPWDAGGAAGGGGAGGTGAGASPDAGDASVDASTSAGPVLGTFKLTYYWVTTEEEFTGAKDTALYDASCQKLATVPAKFAAALKLEGTGRLLDGRILNYDGSCGCPTSPCYLVADAAHPWGYGVQNLALAPFRSVAVDKAEVAIGTRLYVSELDGVLMPGSAPWGDFVHDGCVTAHDVGGGIVGKHVDFFAALRVHYLELDGNLQLSSITVHQGGTRCP